MALASSTNIFQYIPTLRNPNDVHKWKKGHNINDLINRIKLLEQNANYDSPSNSIKEDTDSLEKSPEARGLEQHTKDKTIKIESDKNKLNELIRKSNRSIVSISSVFPWNFFPNTIDVEESRVTFIFRQLFASQSHSVDIKDISNVFIESGFFFATLQIVSKTFIFRQLFASQSHSVDIKDISNVFIESGFFFATLQIVSKTFIQNDIKIEYLKKKDAYRTKDIIEGLRTFVQNDINSSNYEIGDLINKLNELNIPKTMN